MTTSHSWEEATSIIKEEADCIDFPIHIKGTGIPIMAIIGKVAIISIREVVARNLVRESNPIEVGNLAKEGSLIEEDILVMAHSLADSTMVVELISRYSFL
jgi:hypothetical protein